ncbi:hypothetical protein C9374_013596 [Naegleria lovaniensis]|uniref:Uncharacterized protein n=1 Tax=Naegleria lovaniensis TaxID=51637 RepID=A0AA88H310_NAELO|nr:uncharacterized protein C9374_013596 [Naegleria lovaniensis]KAG2392111.1 hypothetical protein C9374_013596 [Naegleria lovaniensis]
MKSLLKRSLNVKTAAATKIQSNYSSSNVQQVTFQVINTFSTTHHVGPYQQISFRCFSTMMNTTRKKSSGKKGGNDDSDDDGEDIFDKLKKLGFLGQGSPEVKKHLESMMDFMLKPGTSMPSSESSNALKSSSSSKQKEEQSKPLNTFLEDEEKLIESFNRVVFEAYKLHRNSFESQLTPEQIVKCLDKHIVGQKDAKRAVAIALRNRFRRKTLIEWYKDKSGQKTTLDPSEIIPKNILMIGPTGCGKTEIARRISKLVSAPFLKVEATKYTELGYHGRDVDTIARDLIDVSINMLKNSLSELFKSFLNTPLPDEEADPGTVLFHSYLQQLIENRLIHIMFGSESIGNIREATLRDYLNMLRNGELDDRHVEIEVPVASKSAPGMSVLGNIFDSVKNNFTPENSKFKIPDIAELSNHQTPFETMLQESQAPTSFKKVKMTVKEAKLKLAELELEKLVNGPLFIEEAKRIAEREGIVFIDEIDKICGDPNQKRSSADASGEGVQKDLLPLLEGCEIQTKYGAFKTDHVLFIASGAFHDKKPSDLMSELQGRLPVRVTLNSLNTKEELYQVLTIPEFNLIRQHVSLFETEGVRMNITDEAIKEIAAFSANCNSSVQNLGARRLIGIIDKCLEELSFIIPDLVKSDRATIEREFNKIGLKDSYQIIPTTSNDGERNNSQHMIEITINAPFVKAMIESSPLFAKMDVRKFTI